MANPIIDLDNISVTFKQRKQVVHAVKDVTLKVEKGDIYGIVGYSGAGKSTLVRTINLLQLPSAGSVTVNGTVFFKDHQQQISNKELQEKRRKIVRKWSACTSTWTTGIRPPHSRTLQTLWHSTARRSKL